MTLTEKYALDLVCRKVSERKAAHKFPEVAILNEILSEARAEITEALERLTEQGILHRTENINRVPMYAPIESQA